MVEQWTIKVKIASDLDQRCCCESTSMCFHIDLTGVRPGDSGYPGHPGAGMDNDAINSKKATKWKPGDDLTLQIEGHACPGCTPHADPVSIGP